MKQIKITEELHKVICDSVERSTTIENAIRAKFGLPLILNRRGRKPGEEPIHKDN